MKNSKQGKDTRIVMYGKSYNPREGGEHIRRMLTRGGIPATWLLIGVNILTWILTEVFSGGSLVMLLAFGSNQWPLPALWSVVTWPLVSFGHPLWFLFTCAWAWFIGGSLERSWGTRTFVLFFFGCAAMTAVSVYLGTLLMTGITRDPSLAVLAGLRHAMAAPTVAWCVLNRRETIYFFLLPIRAIWLAYLTMLILWYEVGRPFIGLFAVLVCVFAWWYATNLRAGVRAGDESRNPLANLFGRFGGRQQRGDEYRSPETAVRFSNFDPEPLATRKGFNPVRWWRDRQERRRLEKILRRSGFTEDDRR